MTLSFNEYQNRTADTAIYPGQGSVLGLLYVGLGLGEQGEVQGKIKKILRDDLGDCANREEFVDALFSSEISDERKEQLFGELGDLLWYVARVADELGFPLSAIAEGNLSKLASRAERGALKGSGDDR